MRTPFAVLILAGLASPALAAGRGSLSVPQTLLLVAGIQALIWVPLLIWRGRRSEALAESIRRGAETARERLLLGPEPMRFSRALPGPVGVVRQHAVLALSGRRLIVQPLLGGGTDIPLDQIAEVTQGKWFRGSFRNGRTQIILKLRDRPAVACIPREPERWVAALTLRK